MKVIVKETCFIDGAVRTPGLPEPFGEFEYTGDPNKLPRSLVPADGAASGAPDKSETLPV